MPSVILLLLPRELVFLLGGLEGFFFIFEVSVFRIGLRVECFVFFSPELSVLNQLCQVPSGSFQYAHLIFYFCDVLLNYIIHINSVPLLPFFP